MVLKAPFWLHPAVTAPHPPFPHASPRNTEHPDQDLCCLLATKSQKLTQVPARAACHGQYDWT